MELIELKEKLNTGNFTLSYTSLKEFSKSPSHFIRYKLGDKVRTDAMKKGNIIHCAILEPDQLEKRYSVLKNSDLPFSDKDFRNAENKKFKEVFEMNCELEGKEIITQAELDKANRHIDLAYNNQGIAHYLNGLIQKEQRLEFDLCGFNFVGYADGIGSNYELDLKTVTDANPSIYKYKLESEKYHWQHFLYSQSKHVASWMDNFNLLIDDNMGISLLKVSKLLIHKADEEVTKLLDQFKMCIENDLWDMNYEFWSNGKGYFEI